ncbi:MAG: hypothetical protein ACRCST_13040 [Turicibacter sp.]
MLRKLFRPSHTRQNIINEHEHYALSLKDIIHLFNYGHLIHLNIKTESPDRPIYRILTCNNVQITLTQEENYQLSIKLIEENKMIYKNERININFENQQLVLYGDSTFTWETKDKHSKAIELLIQSLVIRTNNKLVFVEEKNATSLATSKLMN